ncbi:MAG TPA: energy transducer TonB [Terriglobia bacterium]|nr:energy transducer TonB [Terriglobia bacterium]
MSGRIWLRALLFLFPFATFLHGQVLDNAQPVNNSNAASSSKLQKAKILYSVSPCASIRQEGRITMQIVIGEDGKVQDQELISAPSQSANANAIKDAVGQWTFEPARRDGKPIALMTNLNIDCPPVHTAKGNSSAKTLPPDSNTTQADKKSKSRNAGPIVTQASQSESKSGNSVLGTDNGHAGTVGIITHGRAEDETRQRGQTQTTKIVSPPGELKKPPKSDEDKEAEKNSKKKKSDKTPKDSKEHNP